MERHGCTCRVQWVAITWTMQLILANSVLLLHMNYASLPLLVLYSLCWYSELQCIEFNYDPEIKRCTCFLSVIIVPIYWQDIRIWRAIQEHETWGCQCFMELICDRAIVWSEALFWFLNGFPKLILATESSPETRIPVQKCWIERTRISCTSSLEHCLVLKCYC
jgi:hypothetical protein